MDIQRLIYINSNNDFISFNISSLLPNVLLKASILAKWTSIFSKGKVGNTIDSQLLAKLNALSDRTIDIDAFVKANINSLTKNESIIWEITSATKRGRVWEQVRALTDLKDWTFIGGQNQKLLDFYYDGKGIIMQLKTIGPGVKEATLRTYINSFGKVIKDLDNAVMAKTYNLQGGTTIKINTAQLDIVVPKNLDTSILNILKNRSANVTVNIIIR